MLIKFLHTRQKPPSLLRRAASSGITRVYQSIGFLCRPVHKTYSAPLYKFLTPLSFVVGKLFAFMNDTF